MAGQGATNVSLSGSLDPTTSLELVRRALFKLVPKPLEHYTHKHG